ncbi:MAG TPA: ATP-binding protein [Steroidobacteraceae bacterium]|jgi:two-component system sensor histidine kinase PilS (NtrC family)
MSSVRATTAPADGPQSDLAWRVVGLANLYRLLLPPVLFALHVFTRPVPTVGGSDPRLFVLICALYWALGAVFAFGGRGHWPSRRVLVLSHTLLDSAAVALLLYCSGGASSGLGILLVIPVGAMALLAEGRGAFANAAIAALGILLQQIACVALGSAPATDYPLAGMQGAVVFLVALMAWPVSARLRESEALVRRAVLDLANLAQVSQYIVQHLRESILVADPDDYIRLINESAAQVLGELRAVPGALLGEVSPRLLYLLSTWRVNTSNNRSDDAPTLLAADGARLIRPHFAPLGDSHPSPVIIFLEDTGEIAAKVQQTKLAALGRLSASIAHEIRNPVGAMSHAAQLLAESPALGAEDRRLTEIMQANSVRVSGIIDNVLQLSRREAPKPEQLQLAAWTARFREEFCATVELPPNRLVLDPAAENVEVRIDGSQLHQIAWNLCQNAMIHALPANAEAAIYLRYGRLGSVGRPFLQVADRGPGIPSVDSERIFEPFFTRAERGTGLGLFLARELAAANGATLLYEPRDGGGSIFRVVFADPRRWTDL